MRNQISDLWILCSNALPLSHRDSTVSKVYYEVHTTHVLQTALSSNVDSIMFVNRIREMHAIKVSLILLTNMMLLTLLILAVCRMHIT